MFYLIFILSVLSVFIKWNSLISLLLSIEFMVVALILYIFFSFTMKFVSLIFIVICITEAIMGLVLATFLYRFFGSDHFSNFYF